MFNKLKLKRILLISLISISGLYASDMISIENSVGYEEWVNKNLQKIQFISVGISENVAAIKYTVNSSIIPTDTGPSNVYATFEANDYRVETYLTYDIFRNFGLKAGHYYLRPGIGFGYDIGSGSLSGFGVIDFDYNLPGKWQNWIINFQIKGFFMKQHDKETTTTTEYVNGFPHNVKETRCNDNDCSDTKAYFGLSIGYKF